MALFGTKVSVLPVASSSTCWASSFPWELNRARASWGRKTQPCWRPQPRSAADTRCLSFPVITSPLLLLLPIFLFRQVGLVNDKNTNFQLRGLRHGSKHWSTKGKIPTVLRANCSPFCMMSSGFWFGRVPPFWVVWRSPSPLATEWPFFQSNWPYPLFIFKKNKVIQPLSPFSFTQELHSRETFGGS